MTRDIECYKLQLSELKRRENREKGFEAACVKYYHRQVDLENQLRTASESCHNLNAKLEKLTFEHKQQIDNLNEVLSKTKNDLSNCQAEFREHRKTSRDRVQSYLDDIVELESKLKDYQTVVYKTGNSVNAIQKFTLKPTNSGRAIGIKVPSFGQKALNEMPKLYSAENLFDETVVHAVVYNCEEENDIEDETRSK